VAGNFAAPPLCHLASRNLYELEANHHHHCCFGSFWLAAVIGPTWNIWPRSRSRRQRPLPNQPDQTPPRRSAPVRGALRPRALSSRSSTPPSPSRAAAKWPKFWSREGELVEAGATLIRLDTADLDVAVTQAEARLVQAQANLAAAEAGLLAAEAALETAEIGIEAAQVQLELATSTPLTVEIAILESQIAVANARINQAAGQRDVVLDGPTAAQIQAAEAELAAAIAAQRPIQEAYSQIQRWK
jgi:hypothetical protein